MAILNLWFDPRTGQAQPVAADPSAQPGERWRITCEGDAVSIFADADGGGGGRGPIGLARWTGKGLARREALAGPIEARTWGQLEHALRRAFAEAGAAAEPAEPAEPADPAGIERRELIVDLSTGRILHQQRAHTERRARNAFEWKVEIASAQVVLHAADEPSIARATWDGERLIDRQVRSRQIAVNDYQWGVVERAVIEALTGRAAPMPRAAIDGAAPGADLPAPAPRAAASPEARPDRRSGWWWFAAFGVALAGTLVAWRVMPPGDRAALGVTIALGVLTLGLAIYGGFGLGTRCPSCRAWYRRETTSRDLLGTSTYTKEISKPVYDSSGKEIGTTSETATYERTEYKYYYRCKECGHQWTGTGSSETRVS